MSKTETINWKGKEIYLTNVMKDIWDVHGIQQNGDVTGLRKHLEEDGRKFVLTKNDKSNPDGLEEFDWKPEVKSKSSGRMISFSTIGFDVELAENSESLPMDGYPISKWGEFVKKNVVVSINENTIITKAILQKDGGEYYFCQNVMDGSRCRDTLGQKFSWIKESDDKILSVEGDDKYDTIDFKEAIANKISSYCCGLSYCETEARPDKTILITPTNYYIRK